MSSEDADVEGKDLQHECYWQLTCSDCNVLLFFAPQMSTQTGQEHELIESMPLLEWFANNYKKFGATLEIVTDKSQEGSQFVKGFGGIGGKLQKKNVAVFCFFVMGDLIIWCQHKRRTKQMSLNFY